VKILANRLRKGVARSRSTIAPVREARKGTTLSTPFTTSMIDTLGCSFAALLFLFLVLSSAARLNEDAKQLDHKNTIFGAQIGAQSPLLIKMSNDFAAKLDVPQNVHPIEGENFTTFLVEVQQLQKGVLFTLRDQYRTLAIPNEMTTVTLELGNLIERLTFHLPQPLAFNDLKLMSIKYSARLELHFSQDFPEVLQVELQPVQLPLVSGGVELATIEARIGTFDATTAAIDEKANFKSMIVRYRKLNNSMQFARLQCTLSSPRKIQILDSNSAFRPTCPGVN
jgi:hypothetical protein